ncbi:DUF2155 domain-containing protein [Lichenicola cladoniae]|uniref:DUF2155 domain-containing protein n=1 Tax=Lichenicola cladoniae TaxID=1484109 RepID=A0A6M8HSI6_9PROT|nr:DUF2155 domain-containing protein [Lichenicola cladoniae]NPD65453.1 DUF2155 domain-containing protein [Acetobacteraceae bacterium]QKE91479.1 DUF2155 domain-containing protein [Lichenicola cladoniae]
MRVPFAPATLAVLVVASGPAVAASYIAAPVMPIATAWQGRGQAVVRVLDKLDAHIETMTLKAGETGTYKTLTVTVRSCMDRPDGLPRDSGAFLDIQDKRGDVQPFSGWTFAGEPSVGVFESPIYGVQLVTCQGDLVAPMAPPLPTPAPPPPDMVSSQSPGDPSAGANDGGLTDADTGAETDPDSAAGAAAARHPPANDQTPGDDTQPDPVYPSGAPPAGASQTPPADPPAGPRN